jgi:sRNA-binding carbon storage regulator CsrA
MLVLMRRVGQAIRIGEDVRLVVDKCEPGSVDLCVTQNGKSVVHTLGEYAIDHEELTIGETIVMANECTAVNVSLGFEAPRYIEILREELWKGRQDSLDSQRDRGRRSSSEGDGCEEGCDEPSVIPYIATPITQTELRARFSKWVRGCNWETRPSLMFWAWAATKNRLPDGGVITPADESYESFESFRNSYSTDAEYAGFINQ